MSTVQQTAVRVGMPLIGSRGHRIGTVDAIFSDYLLVRTTGLLPVDLYVPRPETVEEAERVRVDVGRREAYTRWHRPLKQAPHEDR